MEFLGDASSFFKKRCLSDRLSKHRILRRVLLPVRLEMVFKVSPHIKDGVFPVLLNRLNEGVTAWNRIRGEIELRCHSKNASLRISSQPFVNSSSRAWSPSARTADMNRESAQVRGSSVA